AGQIETDAGDVARARRQQESDRIPDVRRRTEPAERRLPAAAGLLLLLAALHLDHLVEGLEARLVASGRDRVDPDAERADLLRKRLGEGNDAGLGGGINGRPGLPRDRRAAPHAGTRSDADDAAAPAFFHIGRRRVAAVGGAIK